MYDVVIAGGGTSGCACAYNAAKLGLKTLLIEKLPYLGGSMTAGLVIPVMKSGENQINTDFYNELIFEMKKANAQITYQDNPGWFNPIKLKDVLYNMLKNVGVDIKLSSYVNHAETENIQILSVHYDTIYTDNLIATSKKLSVCIESKYFVDTTGNLNFSKLINCEFLENKNELPPASLRFLMSGVDNNKFAEWILKFDTDREVTTAENIDGEYYFSTAYTWDSGKHWALTPLFEDAISKNILKPSDCNYFQMFSVAKEPCTVAFNCPRILAQIDYEDEISCQNAYNKAKEAIYRLEKFCNTYLPGFENAYVSKIADTLGIRSYRRIKGKYIYTIDDLKSGKKFDNPAVISDYPVDIHSRNKNGSTLEMTGEYQLPIESLMSNDYDNLYIAGKGLSADEYAQGALRVQSSCFSMGEAVAKDIHRRLTRS